MWSFSSFNAKDIQCSFLDDNNPCTKGNSCFLLFRDCFVFSIKSIDSRFLAAVSFPEGHQLLCIFVFSAALTIPDHCWWSGHSVSPANPGAGLFEGQRHLYNHQATQSTPPPPPSISQSTMKRVTIRAGALLFRSQCLLSNNIICHRGRNLGGCAPVLDWVPIPSLLRGGEDCFIDPPTKPAPF